MTPSDAEMILSCLPIGSAALREHLSKKTPLELLENPPKEIKNWRQEIDLKKLQQKLANASARWVSAGTVSPLLTDLTDAPLGLFAKGSLDIQGLTNAVAIVGTRKPTEYGKRFAFELAEYLASRAIPIISGLALGIDAAAHRGALEAQGPTVGVLGSGIDIVYPEENKSLFEKIGASGLVLSEFPPGRSPDRTTFPRRNRIIVALSQAVVVVESDATGGAMITASIAKKLGRRVFALPGRVDQPTSRGPHKLIQEGASLITSPDDFYRQLTHLPPPLQTEIFPQKKKQRTVSLPSVLSVLSEGEQLSLDELAIHANLPVSEMMPLLLRLELEGKITKRLDGKYECA